MRFWGLLLIAFGAITYVMSLFGRKSFVFFFLDKEYVPVASAVIAAAGIILFVLSFIFRKKAPSRNGSAKTGDTPEEGNRT
jgi:hypothetical protein